MLEVQINVLNNALFSICDREKMVKGGRECVREREREERKGKRTIPAQADTKLMDISTRISDTPKLCSIDSGRTVQTCDHSRFVITLAISIERKERHLCKRFVQKWFSKRRELWVQTEISWSRRFVVSFFERLLQIIISGIVNSHVKLL